MYNYVYYSITGIKRFIFQENFTFLVKTITDPDRLGLFFLNLVFKTVNGVIFCEIYLQPTSPLIHDLFIYFIFKFFFN